MPAYVLRFWETKFAQLQPLKRGGGRRYYRPEDIVLLRRIRQCLYHDGYTIRGVQQLLRARTGRGREEAGAGPTAADAARSKEPASAEPARQAALDEVRRELLAIRSLLHQLIRP